MQKKLLAVAVAGALIAPSAFAQTSVTISGALNLWYESAGASGATNGSAADVKRRDRIQDGAGSNIRFTVVEDMGGGLQAFGQVESAVFNNADVRPNAAGLGAASPGTPPLFYSSSGGSMWGTRNSGVGLRSAAWGEVLMGIWDIHYNEQYAVDSNIIKGNSASSVLALMNTFGLAGFTANPTIGARYNNVLRYQSPNWSGFNFKLAYARPTDGGVDARATASSALGDVGGAKNRVFNFAPQFSSGPIFLGYSYLSDKDITTLANPLWVTAGAGPAYVTNATGTCPALSATGAGSTGPFTTTASGTTGVTTGVLTTQGTLGQALCPTAGGSATISPGLTDIKSHRFSGSYTIPMGLKVGFTYDRSTLTQHNGVAGSTNVEIKRNVWAIPLSYTAGAHTGFLTFARASSLKGSNIDTVSVTPSGATAETVGNQTGAKFLNLGYMYDISKRTTIHLNYAKITNDRFANYDFFANGVGMSGGASGATGAASSAQGASFGADPTLYSIGLRHAF